MGFLAVVLLAVACLVVPSYGCSTTCPPKWTGFNGKCYRLYAAERKNFDGAEAACQTARLVDCQGQTLARGHLASVHSYQEQQFLFQLIRSTIAYTGAWDPQVYIGIKVGYSNSHQTWTDGSRVRYTSWFHGEPNNGPNSRGAIASGLHASGQWADVYSSSTYPYICQLPCVDYQLD